jgi:hypothetical protein
VLIVLEALAQPAAELRPVAPNHDEPPARPRLARASALMAALRAGGGPRRGTRVALVDPPAVAFLAVVIVMDGRRRDGPPAGRGFREALPQDVPVPGHAPQPQASDAGRPAAPQRVPGRRRAPVGHGRSSPPPASAAATTTVGIARIAPFGRILRHSRPGRGEGGIARGDDRTRTRGCVTRRVAGPSDERRETGHERDSPVPGPCGFGVSSRGELHWAGY